MNSQRSKDFENFQLESGSYRRLNWRKRDVGSSLNLGIFFLRENMSVVQKSLASGAGRVKNEKCRKFLNHCRYEVFVRRALTFSLEYYGILDDEILRLWPFLKNSKPHFLPPHMIILITPLNDLKVYIQWVWIYIFWGSTCQKDYIKVWNPQKLIFFIFVVLGTPW